MSHAHDSADEAYAQRLTSLQQARWKQVLDVQRPYRSNLRSLQGRIVIECPQEVGYRSDDTHIERMDFPAIARRLERNGITVEREYSFPFPRPVGKVFIYNQFVTLGRAQA